MDQLQIQQLERRVDEVLYYIWDPIGVSAFAESRGEYSSYTSTVLKYVMVGEVDSIASVLKQIRNKNLGLPLNNENDIKVAQHLLDIKYAVKENLW